jgi:hypothetical protein
MFNAKLASVNILEKSKILDMECNFGLINADRIISLCKDINDEIDLIKNDIIEKERINAEAKADMHI